MPNTHERGCAPLSRFGSVPRESRRHSERNSHRGSPLDGDVHGVSTVQPRPISRFHSCATRGPSPRAADCRLPLFTANHVRDCRGGASAHARVLDRALPLARPPGHWGQTQSLYFAALAGTFVVHTIGDCKCANSGRTPTARRMGQIDPTETSNPRPAQTVSAPTPGR